MVERLCTAGREHDGGARVGEGTGDGGADAPAGARHQDLSFQHSADFNCCVNLKTPPIFESGAAKSGDTARATNIGGATGDE